MKENFKTYLIGNLRNYSDKKFQMRYFWFA